MEGAKGAGFGAEKGRMQDAGKRTELTTRRGREHFCISFRKRFELNGYGYALLNPDDVQGFWISEGLLDYES